MTQITYAPVFFKNLNAIRFISFFMVFIAHAIASYSTKHQSDINFVKHILSFGRLGVDCFFVLSSFLITWKFFEEESVFNKINIIKFYIRRMYRIWPLYLLITALGFGYYFLSHQLNSPINSLPNVLYFLSFTLNIFMAEHGIGFLFFVTFLWSISVEEQFYLFWPILYKVFRKRLVIFSIILIVISLVFRLYFISDSNQIYFNTISVLGNFALGALGAYFAYHFKSKLIYHLDKYIVIKIAIYCLFLVFLSSYHVLTNFDGFIVFERFIISIFAIYFILDQSFSEKQIINLGKSEAINYLGRISYGLYCYHGVVVTIVLFVTKEMNFFENKIAIFIFQPLLVLALTILVSHISYKYFESYFLQRKNKFSIG